MKKLSVLLLSLFVYIFSFSQQTDFFIKNGPKGPYLEHHVAPKEGLYAIGRLYNVHPKTIAAFNNVDLNKGLSIGQLINVPLTDTNFTQTGDSGVPVYITTEREETIANLSVKYKIPATKLRSWNSLGDSKIDAGSKMVVGFLVTSEMPDKVMTLNEKVMENTPLPAIVKDEPAKVAEASTSNSAVESNNASKVTGKEEVASKIEEEKKEPETKKEEPVKQETIVPMKKPEVIDESGTGYFKNYFFQQVKSNTTTKEQVVTSSIFKTASGWQDAKYYLLIDGIEPGTIVRLTNPSNNKTVFAKVLYGMEKIRQNQGVDVRISDAAASSLAVSDTDKFFLRLDY